jgi:hypothetical protein
MGAQRELKKLVENYWSGKIDHSTLLTSTKVCWYIGMGYIYCFVVGITCEALAIAKDEWIGFGAQ